MTRSYLELIRKVLSCPSVPNRTGVGARSWLGHQLRFDLRDGKIPIITTKPTPFNMIANELLWFMRGDTNQQTLEKQGIKIWMGNSSREYLDSRGLYNYKAHESLGPVYGFQWRHFGAKYTDCHDNYHNKGVDQLDEVVHLIKNEPDSRRIILSAWNPVDLPAMALPPCHILLQFHVRNGELSAHLFQRSADLMLGVPFNITSYSLMVHILAKMCNLKTGEFIHTFGDVHIYDDHVYGAEQQLLRRPRPHPTLAMNFDASGSVDQVLARLSTDSFKLINHDFDPRPIKYKMAV